MAKLTDKQQRFCMEYMKDLNATQAAIRAGYSEATANKIGPENLVKLGIKKEIARLKKEVAKAIGVDVEFITSKLKAISQSRYVDLIKKYGALTISYKSLDEIPEELQYCIKQIKTTKEGIDIILEDRQSALDKLAKHIGYYEKDNEQNTEKNTTININFHQPKD